MTALVWYKRDLRVVDHGPLYTATQNHEQVLCVYCIEDEYWKLKDTSVRQWQFIIDSLLDLKASLQKLGYDLLVCRGDTLTIFEELNKQYLVSHVYAHIETGNDWTFKRDIEIRKWLSTEKIAFNEMPSFGVKRVLRDRDDWQHYWRQWASSQTFPIPDQSVHPGEICFQSSYEFDLQQAKNLRLGHHQVMCSHQQKGGSVVGEKLLHRFLSQTGYRYFGGISKPDSAVRSCSRLSPYITYGCISLRELIQKLWIRQKHSRQQVQWSRSLAAFESRLHWHCHFIQKLEDQPSLEFECMHPDFETMRSPDYDENENRLFEAWKNGRTGYPMVDASMRMLIQTGWLNFRMRAMLVSFASYHLWLHWKPVAEYLASLFIDYEPGIHYSQIQMQSGTTGMNIPRIYNPVKQSIEKDPDGVFIRKWVPELRVLPNELIHTPWKLFLTEQQDYKVVLGRDYPLPICCPDNTMSDAKKRYSNWRKNIDKDISSEVIKRHASRKKTYSRKKQVNSMQKDLFE